MSLACRAANEACDVLSGASREDCYAALGIDAERVDDYLGRALCLEAALHASKQANEIVLRTPFGEAHLPRPELPKPPQVPHLKLEELQPHLQRLSEASTRSQEHMRRVFESVAHWQAELGKSAKLMFEEGDDLWNECLHPDKGAHANAPASSNPTHDAPEAHQPQGQDNR